MKKFSEQVLAPHKHMAKKASPYHAHSNTVVYTPSGKEEIRPIDTADAGYGGEAVADAEGGEANPGKASKKAVPPMKMQTLVKVTNEETERERLMKLRSFAAKNRKEGLGKAMVEEQQIDERNMENKAKKDNVVRQVGTHAFIKHGTDAGSPKMTGRKVMKDPKIKSSKVADMYRKLPSMEEAANVTDYNPKSQGGTRVELLRKLAKSKSSEHAAAARKGGATQDELKKAMTAEEYQVVAHAKTGEKFKSGLYPTKEKAQSMHYKLAKSGEHKNIKLVKVSEASDWNGPAEENDMAMTQLHFIKYAAEEIMEAIKVGTDMEEWYQNKLTRAHLIMEGLHSYMEGRKRHMGSLGDPVAEGKMKDIATDKAEDERLAKLAAEKNKKQAPPPPRVGPMEKALEEGEVWDKPMPDSKKQGSLSAEQKAKAKARAARAGRSYPNMIDNMWASKQ